MATELMGVQHRAVPKALLAAEAPRLRALLRNKASMLRTTINGLPLYGYTNWTIVVFEALMLKMRSHIILIIRYRMYYIHHTITQYNTYVYCIHIWRFPEIGVPPNHPF